MEIGTNLRLFENLDNNKPINNTNKNVSQMSEVSNESFATMEKTIKSVEDISEKSKELSQTKHKVFHRLMNESEAYRLAREKRDEALFTSNIETLVYIINDYEEQGKEFPVDWIGKH